MSLLIFLILLLSAILERIQSECTQSYILKCDSFEDLNKYKHADKVSEVMIGSEDGSTNMTTADLMHILPIPKFRKLTSLMVVKAVNKLEAKTYAFQCTYYNTPLKTMIFYGNVIQTINSYFFPVVHLKKMSLVNNKIETIHPWAFRSHPIENLDLSDNLLEVIEAESMPLNEESKILTIRNNKLTHIEPGSFSTSLQSLNLDYNKLRYIQDEIFEGLVNLKELTLSHNNLNVFPKIDQLEKLIVFDISFNSISTIKNGTFKDMDDLKVIDLSNNLIASPMVLQWVNTPNKQSKLIVSLALNRLRSLELENVALQNQTLVLYGNPFDCNIWTELKMKLEGHESECDSKFLSSGNVPYCINYRTGGYAFVSLWDQDIDNLHQIVKKKEKKAECVLTPNKDEWLHPMSWGCVA